jgi:hypothetical protein
MISVTLAGPMPVIKSPGQGGQAAVGGGADGSGAFAEDLSGGAGVEAEHGAQQDGFGLVGGQGGDQGQGGAGGQVVQGVLGGVVGGGQAGQVFGRDGDRWRAAGGAAAVVQGAVPGDGGGPAAEPVVGAGEAGQVAGDLQPGFRGDVFGVVADQGVQVAQQPGLDVAVQGAERVRVAVAGPPYRPVHHRLGHVRGHVSGPLRGSRPSLSAGRSVGRRIRPLAHRPTASSGHRGLVAAGRRRQPGWLCGREPTCRRTGRGAGRDARRPGRTEHRNDGHLRDGLANQRHRQILGSGLSSYSAQRHLDVFCRTGSGSC